MPATKIPKAAKLGMPSFSSQRRVGVKRMPRTIANRIGDRTSASVLQARNDNDQACPEDESSKHKRGLRG